MRSHFMMFALVSLALGVRADCTSPSPRLSVNAADQTLAATFLKDPPQLKAGDAVTLTIGATTLKTAVTSFNSLGPGLPTIIAMGQRLPISVDSDFSSDQAKMSYVDSSGVTASLDLCIIGDFPSHHDTFLLGPVAGSQGDAANDTKPGAIRIQAGRSYRSIHAVRSGPLPSSRNAVTELSLSLDTTDQKGAGFTDDNKVFGGVFSPRINMGGPVDRLRFGATGQISRALHGGDRNHDLMLSLDGWAPPLQAINADPQTRFLASPLQFQISGGRRWQDVGSAKSRGWVAKGSILYHVYLPAGYRLDLEPATVLNDVSNRPASTPRTQHTWKVSLFHLGSAGSRFDAVASYENGHSGPVFTKLRQYFVGVGIKDLLGTIKSH